MNKFKFLSCAVMAAFFAMGITSCEKENFAPNVDIEAPDTPVIEFPDIEIPQLGDAVISIQPQVVAIINGKITNVTKDATITYNGKEKLEYNVVDKGVAAMDVELVASYDYEIEGETKTFNAEYTINVPTLSAGQVAIFTPTLVITINYETEKPGTDEPGTDEPGTDDPETESLGLFIEKGASETVNNPGTIEFKNETNYYYTNVKGSTLNTVKNGAFVEETKINEGYESNEKLATIISSLEQGSMINIEFSNLSIYAGSLTIIPFKQVVKTTPYKVVEKFETRATTSKEAATFNVVDYSYIIDTPITNVN